MRSFRAKLKVDAARRDADAIRARCAASFAEFVREAWPIIEPGRKLAWNWHLDAMCLHLQAITEGTMTPWLIINVPPGSSKSTLVSVLWQAWEWGPRGLRHLKYVSTSYGTDNVKRDTRKTRKLIESEWYRMLWPEVTRGEEKLLRSAETSFENADTGTREGVAFSALMGKRGDRVLIDDPHSLQGAESETERNKAVRDFIEGGLNRVNDALTSAIVIVMQRLHQDDLTGALLARSLGFVHLMIPMEFEEKRRCRTPIDWTDPRSYEGELMDPKRMPSEAVERFKQSEYAWNGQYQQRPAPREGGLFKVEKITKVPADPGGGEVVRGWDLAGTKRKTSAFTVGAKMRRVGGRFVIVDLARAQASPFEVKEMVRKATTDDGVICLQSLPQDPGQAGVAQKMDYLDMLAGWRVRFSPETGDKATRAQGLASSIEGGLVQMVDAPWNAELIEELRGFPTATRKDIVDALSRAYTELVGKPQPEALAGPEIFTATDDDGFEPPPPEGDEELADPWL